MMRSLCALAFAFVAAADDVNDDIILPPVFEDEHLPERMLVFIPGALVPTENYRPTMEAIQKATKGIRLSVVIPAIQSKLCIFQCFTKDACGGLKNATDALVKKSGFQGNNPKEDTFIAGHSLGSVCANNLAAGYNFDYAGLLAFGGYVDETGDTSLDKYPIPVLTMAGELDGGSARPAGLVPYYKQFQKHIHEGDDELALTRKPVQVLPGLDHSDFCPGFFVTAIKDLKSEVSQDVALATIGQGSSAFLHLNSPTSSATKKEALHTMRDMMHFTKELLEPYVSALDLEQSGTTGPWCEKAMHTLSGLNEADAKKLIVSVDAVDTIHDFEYSHSNYTVLPHGGLEAKVISMVEPTGENKSIDCKMISAARIAEQMHVKTNELQCGEVNKLAVETARKLLPEHALKRFDASGRKFCFMDDTPTPGNVGPYFVMNYSISLIETSDCLEVSSLQLNTSIDEKWFPGNHYCKLLPPARAMEWMMTDGLKPFPYNLTESLVMV